MFASRSKPTAITDPCASHLGRIFALCGGFSMSSDEAARKPQTAVFDAARLAFRAAILPVIRLRRTDRNALVFLDRAMFASDWDEHEEGLPDMVRRAGPSPLLPLVDGVLGALKFMQAGASAVKTAYQ